MTVTHKTMKLSPDIKSELVVTSVFHHMLTPSSSFFFFLSRRNSNNIKCRRDCNKIILIEKKKCKITIGDHWWYMNRDTTPRGESKVSVRSQTVGFQCLLSSSLSKGKQNTRQKIYQEKSPFATEQNHPVWLWVCFVFCISMILNYVAVTIFCERRWSSTI